VSTGSGLQTLSAMKYATLLVLTAICLAAETSERCVTSIGIPIYPRLAEQARIEGTVKVGITVDETGAVVKASGISGHQMLQGAAVEKAKTWRFGAAKGKSSVFIITYEFRIEGQEVETPVGCSKVKLDLPTTVEVSSPPIAVQTSATH
jgi:TonB family protein